MSRFGRVLGKTLIASGMVGGGVGIGRLIKEDHSPLLKEFEQNNEKLKIDLVDKDYVKKEIGDENLRLQKQLQEQRGIHKLQQGKLQKEINLLRKKNEELGVNAPKTRALKSSIDKFEDRKLPWYVTVFDSGINKWCITDYSKEFTSDFNFNDPEAGDDDGVCKKNIEEMQSYR